MSRRLPVLAVLALVAAIATVSAPAATTSCPDANAPNELVLSNGSNQTAQIGHAFATSFQVSLANTNGCAVNGALSGAGVEFVAPTGDTPGGTFGSGGTNTVVVGTNSSGQATAPTFTANDVAGSYAVFAYSDYGSVKISVTNTANGVVAAIAPDGGAGQSAAAGAQFADPLRARVTDPNGRAIEGVAVTFVLATGAVGAGASFLGGGAQATGTTDASGVATSPPVVANGTAGRYLATATTSGLPSVATFALENRAAATTIAAAARATLRAVVGARYAQRLSARVLDASGQPLEGASVTFAIAGVTGGAGASFIGDGATATVDADAHGVAVSPPLVANDAAGSFTATASVADGAAPVAFSLENRAGKPNAVVAGAAASESTVAGDRFPVPLAVTVTDDKGNPVAGALVTFAAPARGPSGRFAGRRRVVRVRTDSTGVAVAPAFTANRNRGGYAVRATVRGVAVPAAFALVNRARA